MEEATATTLSAAVTIDAAVATDAAAATGSAATDAAAAAAATAVTSSTTERRGTTMKNRVQCKQDQVIGWLQEFYTVPGNLEKLLAILHGSCPISLRLIDYFVTNYAKKANTSFMLNGRHFLVYFNYKRELNAYSKRLFDPFCRRERIMFEARGIEPFVTTVGQLNFFRWFIEKDIYTHVLENRETIERDMNATLREHYSRSTTRSSVGCGSGVATDELSAESTEDTLSASGGMTLSSISTAGSTGSKTPRKKRSELTSNAMKKVNCHACDVVVSFG